MLTRPSSPKLLFELGCEADALRKTQICLLLSTYRSYPNLFYENERWILTAYRIIQATDTVSSGSIGWKRASVCWMHRFTSLIVGLKWTSNQYLIDALSCTWTDISIQDFEPDYSFSWYLGADLKRHLLSIFVASVGLHVHMGELGKLILRRTSTDMKTMGYDQANLTNFDMQSVEEIELQLEEWKDKHADLMGAEPPGSLFHADASVFRTAQVMLCLAYESVPFPCPHSHTC